MTLHSSETIFVPGTCIERNKLVDKLKGTSSPYVNGWSISGIDLVTKTDDQHGYYYSCAALGGTRAFWAGRYDGRQISGATIWTSLNGCGHAKLNVGNCCPKWHSSPYYRPQYYDVKVYLDGKVIGEIHKGTNSKIFEFAFRDKSIIKIHTTSM